MDACTTSPAEANNFCIKHIFKCNSRKKIENSMKQVCQGTDRRLEKRLDAAKRELSKRNAASCAPTVKYLTQRGQSLGDRNFDNSLKFKSAQVGPNKFIAWNFDLVDPDETQDVDDFTALKLAKIMFSHLYFIVEYAVLSNTCHSNSPFFARSRTPCRQFPSATPFHEVFMLRTDKNWRSMPVFFFPYRKRCDNSV